MDCMHGESDGFVGLIEPDRARRPEYPPPCLDHLAFSLQALYPGTGGVAPTLARPVILLIVRQKRRGLANSDDVRMKSHSCESVVFTEAGGGSS